LVIDAELENKLLQFYRVAGDAVSVGEKNVEMLINAVIVAGLGFFGTLVAVGATGIMGDSVTTLCAAGVSAGFQFFTSLAIQRGLKKEDK